jgi:DDB1- and CUL4-associated factor 13
MKVKTLKRTVGSVERECIGDLRKQARNLDPQYHPLARAREYQRAVTAAKLSRLFAQPLIGNIGRGHGDAVTCSAVSKRSLLPLVSGAADGTVALWDLPSRSQVAMIPAHTRTVTGIAFDVPSGQSFYSCSDDGYVHRWNIHASSEGSTSHVSERTTAKQDTPVCPYGPVQSWRITGSVKSIDHHYRDDQFATASQDAVQLWTSTRTAPLATYNDLWGSSDTVNTVRFHPSETALLAHCSVDRGIGLHDTRTHSALRKTLLQMRSNDLQWNPMEPMIFCVGNEDYNAYTFDMRHLDRPVRIYKGHTAAVMSVAWSPTGREFVTGSYDRTLRIFPINSGTCRDIYHTKRMQRIWTVQYSADHQFIVSGSDDSNLRLWKAVANANLGQATTREESAQQYRQALIRRYQHVPAVRTIVKSRKIPKAIRNQTEQARIQKESAQKKQAQRVKYEKGAKFVPERDTTVVKEVE